MSEERSTRKLNRFCVKILHQKRQALDVLEPQSQQEAVYAFDPLFALFPNQGYRIGVVQMECEACHDVLHQFRNNVAFHSRAEVAAQIKARQGLRGEDTFLDLQSARQDFCRLMGDLIAEELSAIPELPAKLNQFGVSHHPAFANVVSAVPAVSGSGSAFLSCEVLD